MPAPEFTSGRMFRLGAVAMPLPMLLAVLLTLPLSACQRDTGAPAAAPVASGSATVSGSRSDTRPAIDALDRKTADRRKARVAAVRYALDVDLTGSDDFGGSATLDFALSDAAADLTVDFSGGEIDSLEINGASANPEYNGYFLTLPADSLREGNNTVQIVYRHPYSRDGTGLHRFVDPEDGRVYLYTYLWPYYANRLMPAFDQPNLKAELSLTVIAPNDWVVVSTGTAVPEPLDDARARWRFTTSPRMATYVFSLHAGPYAQWQADADGIPIRLFARRSLALYVAADEWLEVTRRGLAHYADYFGIPYPYGKYDQLIVPDFAIGAMENIAAVTFAERRYVQRQASSATERESRANTILHEMAHMWFGNLVTHDWWNGLWLNESFATQMSYIAMVATTGFDDAWHGFFTHRKREAYQADTRVTTHPIEVPVNSTADFFSVFDDITYEKGASVLKQLGHYVGADNYRAGVSAYLQEFAYGTTELRDFIAHQSARFGSDLDGWADDWLYHAGVNTFQVETFCDGDRLASLAVLQAAPPPDEAILREHRTELSLYALDDERKPRLVDVIPATVSGERSGIDLAATGLAAAPCPVFVNPNHGDWAYARWVIDDATATAIEVQLADVPDALERSMLLQALYDHANAGGMPLARYLRDAMRLAARESGLRVQQQIADSVVGTVDLMQRLRPQTDAALAEWQPRLERDLWAALQHAEARDVKFTWFGAWLGIVGTDAGLARVRALLDGTESLPGLELSPDVRWNLLTRLAAYGPPDIESRLAAEAAADGSDYGTKAVLVAQAARPDLAVKRHWLKRLRDPESDMGMATRRLVAAGLFPATQARLAAEVQDEVLGSLPAVDAEADPYFMNTYTRSALQPVCTADSSARLAAAVAALTGSLGTTALRALREARQADAECLALRERNVGLP